MKLIKTKQAHAEAMEHLSELMLADPAADSPEEKELELLAFLIESYEKEHICIAPPTPVEAIKFRMEQQGFKQADLVKYIGSRSKVSEVLNGKRPLSLPMIRKLHIGLGIAADVLIEQPDKDLPDEIPVGEFPVKEMHARGWFPAFRGTWAQVKEQAEEMLHDFFGSSKMMAIPALNRQLVRSNSKLDSNALHAWRHRVLQLATEKKLPSYKAEDINDAFVRSLIALSSFEEGPALAIKALENKGIAVVIEARLPQTHLDGAALLSNQRPVIGLTLRHDRLDNFWFVLLHELAHVKLHLSKGDITDFLDTDIDKESSEKLEKEADEFALNSCISKDNWAELKSLTRAPQIRSAASKLSIHPSILAGRLRRIHGYKKHSSIVGQGILREALGFENATWPK